MQKHQLVQVNPDVEFWGGTVMIVKEFDEDTGAVEVYTRIPGKELEIGVALLLSGQYAEVYMFAEFMPSDAVDEVEAEGLESYVTVDEANELFKSLAPRDEVAEGVSDEVADGVADGIPQGD